MGNTSFRFLMAAGLAAFLTGCITVDFDGEENFDFTVSIDEGPLTFSAEKVINGEDEDADTDSEDAEIEDFASIESFQLDRVTLQVTYVEGGQGNGEGEGEEGENTEDGEPTGNKATTFSGTLSVSANKDGAERTVLAEFKDVPVQQGEVNLDVKVDGKSAFEKLATDADAKYQYKLYLDGSVDAAPAKFSGLVSVYSTAKVKVNVFDAAKAIDE